MVKVSYLLPLILREENNNSIESYWSQKIVYVDLANKKVYNNNAFEMDAGITEEIWNELKRLQNFSIPVLPQVAEALARGSSKREYAEKVTHARRDQVREYQADRGRQNAESVQEKVDPESSNPMDQQSELG